jgi:hypothetical protein
MSIGLDPLHTMQELRENPDYVDLTDTNLTKIRLEQITSRLKKSEVLSGAKLKMGIQIEDSLEEAVKEMLHNSPLYANLNATKDPYPLFLHKQ